MDRRRSARGEAQQSGSGSSQKVWLGVDKKTAMKTPAFYIICIAMFLTGIYAAGINKPCDQLPVHRLLGDYRCGYRHDRVHNLRHCRNSGAAL